MPYKEGAKHSGVRHKQTSGAMSSENQSSKKRSAEAAFGNASAIASPFLPMFEQFRAELDEHHDRRERITKASRDITAASKKM